MWAVGDIGGLYDPLLRLVSRIPFSEDDPLVLLGDLNDRGEQSRQVIEWAMTTPNVITLHSNHGDMMVDWARRRGDRFSPYSSEDWVRNGGLATLRSYGMDLWDGREQTPTFKRHVEWLATRPVQFWQVDVDPTDPKREIKCVCTHAPIHPRMKLAEIDTLGLTEATSMFLEESVIWNREQPIPREFFQFFGHNAHWGFHIFRDDKGLPWAACLDSSRGQDKLTAMHWPTMKVIQEPLLVHEQEAPL